MTTVLTPGMDPSQIETGIEGLHVTYVDCGSRGFVVSFNKPPNDYTDISVRWEYDADGTPATKANPALTLKPQLDWSKPLVASLSETPAKVLASLPDHNLKVVEIKGEVFFAKLSGEVLDSGYRLKNGPVLGKRRMSIGSTSSFLRPPNWGGPGRDEAEVQLTYTDGILTGAEVVTPNREPHA